jgi:hypothetical protein
LSSYINTVGGTSQIDWTNQINTINSRNPMNSIDSMSTINSINLNSYRRRFIFSLIYVNLRLRNLKGGAYVT